MLKVFKKNYSCYIIAILLCFGMTGRAQAQGVTLRNNLLYDATLTPNLGLEFRIDSTWSVGLNAGFNAWDIDKAKNKKWRHLMLSPNVRYYLNEHNFVGIHGVYSHYNVSNVKFPLGLYPTVKNRRLQGDLVALGASYGHRWDLSWNWKLEAELGAALGYTWFKEYDCAHCGTYYGKDNKPFVLPKLALNIVYQFGRQPEEPVIIEVPEPEPVVPQLIVNPVPDFTGRAGILQADNPVLEHISKYKPYDRTRILRKEKGALYVHFPVDKSLLELDFRDNAQTLDRIVDITRQIMADTTSTVKKIQIIGLASIEGPIARNEQLAADRAEALKQYIQQRVDTPDDLYDIANGGEAWAELRDQLGDELLAGNDTQKLQAAIDIIDAENDANLREQKLRRLDGGKTWLWMKEHVLSDQRNSGYLRIYYDYVPDRAAAVINQASDLLRQERYTEALALLEGVRTDVRAQNALGVALYMTGRHQEALNHFRRAAANGDADAQRNLKELETE